jgi:hypothetical protein
MLAMMASDVQIAVLIQMVEYLLGLIGFSLAK